MYTLKSGTGSIIVTEENPLRQQHSGQTSVYQTVQQPFLLLPNSDTEPPAIFENNFNHSLTSLSLMRGPQGNNSWMMPSSSQYRHLTGNGGASQCHYFPRCFSSPWFNWPCTHKCFRETQGSTAGALYYQFINAGIKNSFLF